MRKKKKMILAAAAIAVAPFAVFTASLASAAPAQWKITVNGQRLANAGGSVSCGPEQSGFFDITVHPNGSWVSLSDPTTVSKVSISSDTGDLYGFLSPADNRGPTGRGDAQLNKSGNTYNITGHIGKGNLGSLEFDKNSPLVPFEFDATCP